MPVLLTPPSSDRVSRARVRDIAATGSPVPARTLLDWTNDRAVLRWLIVSAVAITAAIAVGGITRLTDSGSSITEWKPVAGVLPPLNAWEWNDAYARYLTIPEAQTVHRGINLAAFKQLFWWEWVHRLLARGVGLVLALPYFVLLLRGSIRPALRLRLANLPLLAALQGVMGWYMVQSGLTGRTSVSQYRLVAHLGIALVVFAIAVWTAVAIGREMSRRLLPTPPPPSSSGVRLATALLTALALCTMLSGGFVAGLDAGRIFNTFPLMEGALIPPGYWGIASWRNLFENAIAVQLHHRVLALATAMLVWSAWIVSEWTHWSPYVQRWMRGAAFAAAAQVSLGIATLLFHVPVATAVLHQLGAVALLTMLLGAAADAHHAPSTVMRSTPTPP